MSIAEWHTSKMDDPVYRANIRYGIMFILGITPSYWTFCLGWGSVYCIMEALRTTYGPRIGNDGMASAAILLPAAGLLCFKTFQMIIRKSLKAALCLAAVTNMFFFAVAVWLLSR